ncbi:MAG: hypothetical protein KAU50_04270 [Candidatus Marinimicrobia bacterium]|nr:hypothetical protein [Candidatus Neomarinimicrobiota bacterium]
MKQPRWFEHYPKTTLIAVNVIIIVLLLVIAELIFRFGLGLGNPVLYNSNPIYGYRPIPNQETTRFRNTRLKFNNLGLRADDDWDANIENKVLFIGNSVTYGGSYIANNELFTHLAVEGITGYMSGNAGVNGWGVENMYGLLVETEFLPARTYVTIVGKQDFYRGLTRLPGLPFWCNQPTFALKELLFHFYYLQSNKRYRHWQTYADEEFTEQVVEKAVLKLKGIDEYVKSRDYAHLIYISPPVDQVLGSEEKDSLVLKYLEKHDLEATYLLDRIKQLNIDPATIQSWFYSDIHLEKQGHAVWGRLINEDLKQLLTGNSP